MSNNHISHDISTNQFMPDRFIQLFNLDEINNPTRYESNTKLVGEMHEISEIVNIWPRDDEINAHHQL